MPHLADAQIRGLALWTRGTITAGSGCLSAVVKALKSVGWQWQKTRRTDPARAKRHWLVLATATLLPSALRAAESRARPGVRAMASDERIQARSGRA